MTFVVDTNVAVVANGKEWIDRAPGCVLACNRKLTEIKESGRVAVDDRWEIVGEYRRKLRESGEPGAGDAFLKWLLTNLWNPERCDQVKPETFPGDASLAAFHSKDRKFVTVAMAHLEHPPILEATDSDWRDFAEALARYVVVDFLCG